MKEWFESPTTVRARLRGPVLFGSRFVVQWWASERRKQVVIPRAFWYLSLWRPDAAGLRAAQA